MANTNLAVAVNNIIFCTTAPTLPSKELLDNLAVTHHDVTVVTNDIRKMISNLNESRRVLLEYIGELDFFNEVTGLACYCEKNGGYTYDFREDASEKDYPEYTDILVYYPGIILKYVDIIIDATEMTVYRVHRR